MSEITPFDFNGKPVRVITIDGEPWWFASEVGPLIGFERPNNAVTQHVDQEDRTTTPNEGGGPDRIIINESGLYALIFGSRLESAKEFKRWVTRDVLPAIRRTGTYSVKPVAPVSALDALAGMVDALREQERITLEMKREQTEQRALLADQQEAFADVRADVDDLKEIIPITAPTLLTLRDVAQAYSPDGKIGQNKMARILDDAEIIFKDHQGGWRAYQPWITRGWARSEFEQWQNGNGWAWVTKFTPAGLAEIMRRMRNS